MLAVERLDRSERLDPVGSVAAAQRRQRTGDQYVAARRVARLRREPAGHQVRFLEAVLDALQGEFGADHAVGIDGDDVGAGGDEVGMRLAHHLGRDDQRVGRPDLAGDVDAAAAQLAPHAAIHEHGALG